jgi:hypothetical protein
MNGAGDANINQNMVHQGYNQDWHFVYFGYSKAEQRAFAWISWRNGVQKLDFPKARHYWSEKFYFLLKDARYQFYSGQVALVNVILGKGAFRVAEDYGGDPDIFNFKSGSDKFKGTVAPIVSNSGKDTLKAPVNGDAPLTKEHTLDQLPQNINEYGYGFWLRFLTHYPVRMWGGKDAAWYFTARLTINQNFADAGFGDRLLAIWQGQGYYHFTTCNSDNGNPNYTANINYPDDIEGLWTYVYYSHGKAAKRSVGLIKYGAKGQPQRIQHDVQHPAILYLKFILAGK